MFFFFLCVCACVCVCVCSSIWHLCGWGLERGQMRPAERNNLSCRTDLVINEPVTKTNTHPQIQTNTDTHTHTHIWYISHRHPYCIHTLLLSLSYTSPHTQTDKHLPTFPSGISILSLRLLKGKAGPITVASRERMVGWGEWWPIIALLVRGRYRGMWRHR